MLKQKIFLAILLTGCASGGQSTTAMPRPDRVIATDEKTGETIRTNDPGPAAVTLRAPQDSVMTAVGLTYLFLKIPVTHYDKSIGEQGNKLFVMSRTFDGHAISNYLNCGDDPFRGPNADANRVTVSLVTRTQALSPTRTALQTIFSGYISKPGNSGTIYCTTTGSLELHIAEMVASRVTQH